jgi:hypothetical protein
MEASPAPERIYDEGMRLWMIWAVLSVIWALQAALALTIHHLRPAIVMFAMAALFAVVGYIVRKRMLAR